MYKITQALRSRTFWTVVILAAINTVPQLRGLVSQPVLDGVNVALTFIAGYFHVNPSQQY